MELKRLFCALLLAFSGLASAQTQTVPVAADYARLTTNRSSLGTGGVSIFGDRVDLYSGALDILHSDVSLSGNSSIPVSVGRRFVPNQQYDMLGHFGDWELEVPRIHGVFAGEWTVPLYSGQPTSAQYNRCSQYQAPPARTGNSGGGSFAASEYWSGTFLYRPGAGDQEILRRNSATPAPTDGRATPLVTRDGTVVRCLSTLDGMGTGHGEGFEVLTPDGLTYRFDHLVMRFAPSLTKSGSAPLELLASSKNGAQQGGKSRVSPTVVGGGGSTTYMLRRQENWILPTRVSDRFGNSVVYTWNPADPWQLSSITASDGRQISLTYGASSHRIATVSDGTRTWRYDYASTYGSTSNLRLSTVTLPDLSAWTFNLDTLRYVNEFIASGGCGSPGSPMVGTRTGTVTHPSGGTESIDIAPIVMGRSWVPLVCGDWGGDSYTVYPAETYVPAVTKRTISGPGLPAGGLVWRYAYGASNNCYQPGSQFPVGVVCNTGSPTVRTVDVTTPDQSVTRYTYGNRYLTTEGQLQRMEEGVTTSGVARSTSYLYASADAGPYPYPIGTTDQPRNDGVISTYHMPLRERRIVQTGQTFVDAVATGCTGGPYCFDQFARPTRNVRSSAPQP